MKTVKLIVHGERPTEVNPVLLDEAKADHAAGGAGLEDLLSEAYLMVDHTVHLMEDDGTITELYRLPRTPARRGLRSDTVTTAVQQVLEQAQHHPGCQSCEASPAPCLHHLAQALVAACRAEQLMILPGELGEEAELIAAAYGPVAATTG